jgi:hypothetical protein
MDSGKVVQRGEEAVTDGNGIDQHVKVAGI